MNTRLLKIGAAGLFGAATLGMVDVLTGSIHLGTEYSIGTKAPLVAFLALATAAVLHGPRIKQMDLWEIALATAAFAVPIMVYIGEPVAALDLFGDGATHHPWSSLAVAAVGIGGFWVASWR